MARPNCPHGWCLDPEHCASGGTCDEAIPAMIDHQMVTQISVGLPLTDDEVAWELANWRRQARAGSVELPAGVVDKAQKVIQTARTRRARLRVVAVALTAATAVAVVIVVVVAF